MELREAEEASSRLKKCPGCSSTEGFWLGLKHDRFYVQCKSCGTRFEKLELYVNRDLDRPAGRRSFFSK